MLMTFGRRIGLRQRTIAAESDPRVIIWHPEVSVVFGTRRHIFLHRDMEDPKYEPLGLAITNYWTALCFAPRSLLVAEPYPETRIRGQIGYEDWAWNMATIALGALHKVVPGTGHAIRSKKVSLLTQTNAASCLPRPSNLFRDMIERKAAESCAGQSQQGRLRSSDDRRTMTRRPAPVA